ncbi:NAD(P)-binding domain-containing protein [soil metagenome]
MIRSHRTKRTYAIVIVGTGAAGIGLGLILEKSGFRDYVILERNEVGASFAAWPSYTRFISPSFAGNFFNAVDLNAVSPDTSPAYTLQTEHPGGEEYAGYLRLLADHYGLRVHVGTDVNRIVRGRAMFEIHTDERTYRSPFVVWAGGEFGNPHDYPFAGAEHCIHSSATETFPNDDVTIVGGFESGIELAIHCLGEGRSVTVIDAGEPWLANGSDSSLALAPSTRDRLRPFLDSPRLRLRGHTPVSGVESVNGHYQVRLESGETLVSPAPPVLATGYHPLSPVVANLFEQDGDGVVLTENDESTITPGLFLTGPRVQHSGAIFCFIYKFRQRLPVVADAIGSRIGISLTGIEEYKAANMVLDDLSCCLDECTC